MAKRKSNEITEAQVKSITAQLNRLLHTLPHKSTFLGLKTLTAGLAALCDIYAQPNEANPLGMVDDPKDLRRIMANLLLELPTAVRKPRSRND